MSPAFADMLEGMAVQVTLSASDMLFHQGDPANDLFRIDEGLVEISVVSPDGRRCALNVLGEGDLLGEIALFSEGTRTASATALRDCRVSRFARRDLFSKLATDPELALEMIQLAGQRLRWMSQQFEDQAFLSAEARLARKLLFLLDRIPSANDTVEVSQAALADHVGVTRELVSKSLSGWKKRGWVALGRGRLTVLDRNALAEFSSADLD